MKKNPIILIIGIVLLCISSFLCIYTNSSSYKKSQSYGEQIVEVKATIANTEEKLADSDIQPALKESLETTLAELQTKNSTLTDMKLSAEKPYSYSLTFLFISIVITLFGILKMVKKDTTSAKTDLNRLAQAGLLAALCYIGFVFFKIDLPVGSEKTAFHLGNVFCVLAALLLGGFWGGLSGAIGMSVADLTTAYATSAPKTFLLKLCIGLIVGLIAHKIFKIEKTTDKKKIVGVTILASTCGMAFNVVADPLIGYLYKTYLLGVPQVIANALAKISALTSFVNAIVAVIVASIFYLALRPALRKAGLLSEVS